MSKETTTKFKVDISELKAGVQEANRQIALANSQFKEASAGMDNWKKSTEGISAKRRQLQTVTKNYNTILSDLEKEYDKVVKEQGENSQAAIDLKVSINNLKASIKGNASQIAKYEKDLHDLEDGLDDAGNAANDMDDAVKTMGDGFTVVKGAIASFIADGISNLISALGNAVEESREYRSEMAKLNTAFETSGHATTTAKNAYGELVGVIGETDQAVEASQQIALLAKSEENVAKWADLAAGVVGRFGDALQPETFYESANETLKLGEATGAYTQMLEGCGYSVEKFNKGLAACKTESEKQVYMLEVTESLLGDASEKYKENNASVIEANKVTAQYNETMAQLGAAVEPVVTAFKSFGTELIQSVVPGFQELGKGFSDLLNGVEGAGATIGTALSGIIESLLTKTIEILPQVTQIALTLVTSLIDGILAAIPQLITTLVSMLETIWSTLSTELPKIATEIVNAIPQIIETILQAIPQLIEAAKEYANAIIDAIPQIVQTILEVLPQIIDSIINGLLMYVTTMIEAYITLLTSISQALPQIIDSIVAALPQIINSIIGGLLTAIPQLIQAYITLFLALVQAIPQIIVSLVNAIPQIIDAIITALLTNIPVLLDAAVQVFMALVQAIPQIIVALVEAIPQLIEAIVTAVFTLIPKLGLFVFELIAEIGKWIADIVTQGADGAGEFLEGVIQTIKELPGKIWEWLLATISKVAEWHKNMTNKAKEVALGFINKVIEVVSSLPGKIWTWFTDIVNKVVTWGVNLQAKGKQAAMDLFNSIVEKLKELPTRIVTIGSDIVKGLWNGIKDMGKWIAEKLKSFGDSVLGSIKSFFGIKSPSRVMRDQVGKPIVQGVAEGIKRNTKLAVDAIEQMGEKQLASEKKYLQEKERLEKEAADKEYQEKLANAKDAAEIEKIKQEKIAKEQEEAQKAYLENLKECAESEREVINRMLDYARTAFEEFEAAVDAIVAKQEKYADRLMSETKATFSKISFTFADGTTEDFYKLPDMSGTAKQLSDFSALLDEVFAKRGDLPEEIKELLANMDMEEGTGYLTAMLNASDMEWQQYVASFAERESITARIGEKLFNVDPTEAWTTAWENLPDEVKESWEDVKAVFTDTPTFFGDTFTQAADAIKPAIVEMAEFLCSTVNEMLEDLQSMTINGINPFGGLDWRMDVPTTDVPEMARGGVLAKGQIGLLEGNGAEAVVPLENNVGWIRATARDLKAQMKSEGLVSGSPQAVTNKNYNFVQNNTSPKPLSRLEIYRQTHNLLSFARG